MHWSDCVCVCVCLWFSAERVGGISYASDWRVGSQRLQTPRGSSTVWAEGPVRRQQEEEEKQRLQEEDAAAAKVTSASCSPCLTSHKSRSAWRDKLHSPKRWNILHGFLLMVAVCLCLCLCRQLDWRPEKKGEVRKRHEKVVIIRNMFHPSDFEVQGHTHMHTHPYKHTHTHTVHWGY